MSTAIDKESKEARKARKAARAAEREKKKRQREANESHHEEDQPKKPCPGTKPSTTSTTTTSTTTTTAEELIGDQLVESLVNDLIAKEGAKEGGQLATVTQKKISELESRIALLIDSVQDLQSGPDPATILCQSIRMACALVFTDEVSDTGSIKKTPLSFEEYCHKNVTNQELTWHGMKPFLKQWLNWLLMSDSVDPSRTYLEQFLTYLPRLRQQLTVEQ